MTWFGRWLALVREMSGMTEDELSKRSAIAYWVIRGYEAGTYDPPFRDMAPAKEALRAALRPFVDANEGAVKGRMREVGLLR